MVANLLTTRTITRNVVTESYHYAKLPRFQQEFPFDSKRSFGSIGPGWDMEHAVNYVVGVRKKPKELFLWHKYPRDGSSTTGTSLRIVKRHITRLTKLPLNLEHGG